MPQISGRSHSGLVAGASTPPAGPGSPAASCPATSRHPGPPRRGRPPRRHRPSRSRARRRDRRRGCRRCGSRTAGRSRGGARRRPPMGNPSGAEGPGSDLGVAAAVGEVEVQAVAGGIDGEAEQAPLATGRDRSLMSSTTRGLTGGQVDVVDAAVERAHQHRAWSGSIDEGRGAGERDPGPQGEGRVVAGRAIARRRATGSGASRPGCRRQRCGRRPPSTPGPARRAWPRTTARRGATRPRRGPRAAGRRPSPGCDASAEDVHADHLRDRARSAGTCRVPLALPQAGVESRRMSSRDVTGHRPQRDGALAVVLGDVVVVALEPAALDARARRPWRGARHSSRR